VLIALGTLSVVRADATSAYFSDAEHSNGNAFSAGAIDFTVATSSEFTLSAGGAQSFSLSILPGSTTLPFLYSVTASATGTPALCAALTVDAGAPLPFNGSLATLQTSNTSSLDTWPLTISLPNASGVADGDTCVVDLTYRGWEQGGAAGTEFHDDEHVFLTIHAHVEAPPVILQDTLPTENLIASTTPL
jgi:predicted ribosomally synthesized peptide with SipW-like signal peptide